MKEARGKESESQQLKYDRFRWAVEALAVAAGIVLWAFNLGSTSWQAQVRLVLGAALLFFSVVAVTFETVLHFSARRERRPELPKLSDTESEEGLDPEEMLTAEFEYARITASEALNDRHTVVNFYLLLTGAVLSVVLALLGANGTGVAAGVTKLPGGVQAYAGTLLLWVLCVVGLLYLLQAIRLRQAWYESARTMNQIKEFYIERVAKLSPQEFSQAFRWREKTLPKAEKMWTISFFSAELIALLNSLVYVVGGLLLAGGIGLQDGWPWVLSGLAFLGLVQFIFSLYMYVLFLKRKA